MIGVGDMYRILDKYFINDVDQSLENKGWIITINTQFMVNRFVEFLFNYEGCDHV